MPLQVVTFNQRFEIVANGLFPEHIKKLRERFDIYQIRTTMNKDIPGENFYIVVTLENASKIGKTILKIVNGKD